MFHILRDPNIYDKKIRKNYYLLHSCNVTTSLIIKKRLVIKKVKL